jgi:hypothetical protein
MAPGKQFWIRIRHFLVCQIRVTIYFTLPCPTILYFHPNSNSVRNLPLSIKKNYRIGQRNVYKYFEILNVDHDLKLCINFRYKKNEFLGQCCHNVL